MKTVEISLFSGVGMFSYGFQRVNPNHRVGCFVECEAYPQRVLRHHWPDVPIYDDVRDVTYERLQEDGIVADTDSKPKGCDTALDEDAQRGTVVRAESGRRRGVKNHVADTEGAGCQAWCGDSMGITDRPCRHEGQFEGACCEATEQIILSGGFPCQDLSTAGKQAGIDGERSGLWSEYARIISELRHLNPIVFIENVPTLFTGESGAWGRRVLSDLAEIFLHGDRTYRVEGHIIPAGSTMRDGRRTLSAGAPHQRLRAWIVAYPETNAISSDTNGIRSHRKKINQQIGSELRDKQVRESGSMGQDVAYPDNKRPQGERPDSHQEGRQGQNTGQAGLCNGTDNRTERKPEPELGLLANGTAARLARHRWLPEPPIGRVATGIPDRAAKLKALGNGLTWPIPAAFMSALMEYYE